MAGNAIDEIMEKRKAAEKPAGVGTENAPEKFFALLPGADEQANFLELQFRDGLRLCLAYGDLMWFHHIPDESCIDMEFGGFLVSVKGRGLGEGLFAGLKTKRVSWIREASSEMEDHAGNSIFIEEITMVPPKGFAGQEEAASES